MSPSYQQKQHQNNVGLTDESNGVNYDDVDEATRMENRRQKIVDSIYELISNGVLIDVASNIHRLIKTEGSSQELLLSSRSGAGDMSCGTSIVSSHRELYPELYKDKNDEEIQQLMEQYAVDYPNSRGRTKRPIVGDSINSSSNNDDNDNSNITVSVMTTTRSNINGDDDDEDDDDEEKEQSKRKRKKKDDDDSDYEMEEDKDDDEIAEEYKQQKKRSTTTPAFSATTITTTGATTGVSTADTTNTTENGTNNTKLTTTTTTTTTTAQMDIWGKIQPKESKDLTCHCRLCGRHVSTSRFASHLDKCMGLSTRPLAGSMTRG
jgi:hypothetical protein